jgi:hypothetical protein
LGLVLQRGRAAGAGNYMNIATDNLGNPILEQFSEDGFVDCVLKISDLVESSEYFNFHISASSEAKVVGMDIVVRKPLLSGLELQQTLMIYDVR